MSRTDSTLDLQNLVNNEAAMTNLKAEVNLKIQEYLEVEENQDFLNYVVMMAINENQPRSSIVAALQEYIQDVSMINKLMDWFFQTMKPKYSQQMTESQKRTSLLDEFGVTNDFGDETSHVVQTTARRVSNIGSGNQNQNQKKVISLNRTKDAHSDSQQQQGGDIASRLQKRGAGSLNVDLETLIRQEKNSKVATQNRSDIFKRVKKTHEPTTTLMPQRGQDQQHPFEEVKLNPASGTIIDLSTHKNNIRVKPSVSAIETFAQGSDDFGVAGSTDDKKKIKCKHFPNCRETDENCPYYHPKEECKFFPNCSYGEKCLYIHPDIPCKFGLSCTRANCAYKHPKKPVFPPGIASNPSIQQAMSLFMMASGLGGMINKPKHANKKYVAGQKPKTENAEEHPAIPKVSTSPNTHSSAPQ